jgi:hypothetical protein
MRRRPHVLHQARVRVADRVRALTVTEEANWPKHLKLACKILHDELGLPAQQARKITINSVSPAHACAQAIDRRANSIAEYDTRIKARQAFARLAKCARRGPAGVRRCLDERVRPLVQCCVVDSEVIEEILGAATSVFAGCPDNEAARTALRALSVTSSEGRQTIGLCSDYSGLHFDAKRECETALVALAEVPTEAVTAATVFDALGVAITTDRAADASPDVSGLIVRFVVIIATLWREVGLHPTRATRRWDPKYKSRFHRFVELVLTAVTEPSSRRHDDNIDQIANESRVVHGRLPSELRRFVSPRLRRADIEWLVSDDHVKKALRTAI